MPLASTPFTLKPAISMTTPGLIKGMNSSDLGTDDFSSVDLIFNEIYDTSDSQPTYFLGATTTPSSNLTALFPGVSGGVPFTSAVQTAATKYQAEPEKYAASFGTWDNVPAGQNKQLQTSNITYIDDNGNLQTGVQTVTNSNGTTTLVGAATVYNTGLSGTGVNNQYCALMNTSKFNPWDSANGSVPWILSYNGPVVADTVNYKDYYALAWALEGSRYDLYNGAWAADAKTGSASSIIDYSTVQQGQYSADGSLLWSDLSTGLKPRVAARLLGIQLKSGSVKQTTNAMAGNVWMLSCQAGPYVNAMGVCASKRSGTGGVIDPTDLLTFTYPGSGLDWPGWDGMKNQWWGIGSATNANVNVKAILDQQKWGVNDTYNPPSTIIATGSSEDNFGVFSDFNIQFAAWVQMALDAQGIQGTETKRGAASLAGITSSMSIKYSVDGTGLPKLGCYELGFLPMSWFSTSSSIPSTVSFP